MAFGKIKQFFSGRSRDAHRQEPSPRYDPAADRNTGDVSDPDVARQDDRAASARENADTASTPPRDTRTDPGRGTGELGVENVEPDQPLSH